VKAKKLIHEQIVDHGEAFEIVEMPATLDLLISSPRDGLGQLAS